jgi:GT2 family glycosyltransferase/spore maturation protein CgeB
MWPIGEAQPELLSVPPELSLKMKLGFEHWDSIEHVPSWIGIVSKPRNGKSYMMHQRIWTEKDASKWQVGKDITFETAGGSIDQEYFLCVHFEKFKGEAHIGTPILSWDPLQRIGIVEAAVQESVLRVAGWVLHDKQPGMPVRLQLLVDDNLRYEHLARSLQKIEGAPPHSFAFTLRTNISKFERSSKAVVRIKDSAYSIPISIADLLQKEQEVKIPVFASADISSPLGLHKVVGKVERFNQNEVVGWALVPDLPDTPIELVLSANGTAVAHTKTSRYRDDVQAVHGGKGFSGFRFELPPNLSVTKRTMWSVDPIGGQNQIKLNKWSTEAKGRFIGSTVDVHYTVDVQPRISQRPSVSAIVLNRNCGDLLHDLLRSAAKHEPWEAVEWIIVDHQSTDHSEDVCRDAVDRGQIVHFLKRNGNYSFSDSNNFGARYATHDVLMFVNNDLVFAGPFIEKILAALEDETIGIVGTKLLDYVENPNWYESPIPQHVGVYLKPYGENRRIRPYESRRSSEHNFAPDAYLRTPAVTGAMMAMRAEDFRLIDGWDTEYIYGLEDIDLCFRVASDLGKSAVSIQGLAIHHHRGFSRSKETDVVVRQRNNSYYFNKRWGLASRSAVKAGTFSRPAFWTGARPTVAFVVVDHGDLTTSGEYYTALELGLALQRQTACHITYLKEEEWYDLEGIDVLVVMVNRFDIKKVKNVSPFLITVNWTRQWFDRWAQDETIFAYDYVFASSKTACRFLSEQTGRNVSLLQIAANLEHMDRGKFGPNFESDYCLTANKVGTDREIENVLVPESIDGVGAIFGHNWEGTRLEPISRGPIPYSQIPNVYASTKIVLDDANVATKEWGSCNSRVFDSLASGCLLITNGKLGVDEAFGELVPTFSDQESLTQVLNYWLKHDAEREALVQKLATIVRTEHNYDVRAKTFISYLSEQRPLKVAIKCAAKFKERHIWGDFHFANSIARSMRKLGYVVRVDCIESWSMGLADTDDVVIVLSGRENYIPHPHQLNFKWIISHPGSVSFNDLTGFDHVFVASEHHAQMLSDVSSVPVEVMLQCTDIEIFNIPTHKDEIGKHAPIFVGNSRGVFRQAVRWSAELEHDFDLYGFGWEQFISDTRLKGINIPNDVLSSFYSTSRFTLCDHWEDMKKFGYLSNRAFDVLASGGYLVVDDVTGIGDILPGGFSVFKSKEDLAAIFNDLKVTPLDERMKLAEWVRENHSFDARAQIFHERIGDHLARAPKLIELGLNNVDKFEPMARGC